MKLSTHLYWTGICPIFSCSIRHLSITSAKCNFGRFVCFMKLSYLNQNKYFEMNIYVNITFESTAQVRISELNVVSANALQTLVQLLTVSDFNHVWNTLRDYELSHSKMLLREYLAYSPNVHTLLWKWDLATSLQRNLLALHGFMKLTFESIAMKKTVTYLRISSFGILIQFLIRPKVKVVFSILFIRFTQLLRLF